MDSWTFTASLGRDRLDALEDAPPFEEMARSIATVMRTQCSHVDTCDEADGFKRVVACVVIDRTLFDLFFNSYNGYRGWCFRSTTQGLRMNELLLQLLAPRLIEFQSHEEMPANLVSKSLLGASAKSWLAEVGKGFCPACEGDWSAPKDDAPEILNGRWEIAMAPNSRFGRKAPFLEKLRVMGAFVNKVGEEYVPKRKLNRAQEIHDVGWS
jgi:hypothetical protein